MMSSSMDAFTQNQRLGRGVNIIGYDPIWRSRLEGRMQDKHFRLIREAGFSPMRINSFSGLTTAWDGSKC